MVGWEPVKLPMDLLTAQSCPQARGLEALGRDPAPRGAHEDPSANPGSLGSAHTHIHASSCSPGPRGHGPSHRRPTWPRPVTPASGHPCDFV